MATVKKPRKSKPIKHEVGSGNVFRDIGFSKRDAAIMEAEGEISVILRVLERVTRQAVASIEVLRYSKGYYHVGINLQKRRRRAAAK